VLLPQPILRGYYYYCYYYYYHYYSYYYCCYYYYDYDYDYYWRPQPVASLRIVTSKITNYHHLPVVGLIVGVVGNTLGAGRWREEAT